MKYRLIIKYNDELSDAYGRWDKIKHTLASLLGFVILLLNVNTICSLAQSGAWHTEITVRPRLLYLPSEKAAIVNGIQQNPTFAALYRGIYSAAKDNPTDQKSRSQIAKAASFVLAMEIEPSGNYFAPLISQNKTQFENTVLSFISTIDPTVKDPSTNYQWRAVELAQFCQAYDLLLGTGHARDTSAENRLAQFAANTYKELSKSSYMIIKNNLSIKLASALGIAAVTLNSYSSNDPDYQPANWIARAMTFIDDVFWNIQSSATKEFGYAESPYYFRYAMMSAAPFFCTMKNFNGDWTESYNGKTIRSPFYDPRYFRLYDWAAKIRMPDGRLPAFDDSYLNSYFPELGIFSSLPSRSYYAWKNFLHDKLLTASELGSQLTGTYDSRAEYISAGVLPTQEIPSNWNPTTYLPDAGYTVFRNSWNQDATYLAMIGKHDSAGFYKRWSPIGHGHKQANETAFILQSGGELLITEPGYYSYDTRDSLIFSPNHNVILVDGKGPDSGPYKSGSFLAGVDAFVADTLSSFICDIASIRTQYQGSDIKRKVYFLDKTFFIVRDNALSQFSRRYTHQLHGNGLAANGTCMFDKSNQSAIWTSGDMHLFAQVNGFTNSGTSMQQEIVTRKHAPSYRQFAEHSALYSSIDGDKAVFTTLLYPYSGGNIPSVVTTTDETKILSTIISGSKTQMAMTNKKGETIEIRGPNKSIATDATFAFYSTDQTHPADFDIVMDDAGQFNVNAKNILWTPVKIAGVFRYTRSSIRGTLRGANLQHIELATEYMPSSMTGKNVTRWYMSSHKIILECSGSDADFDIQLSNTPVHVEKNDLVIPDEPYLEQNHPNPFSAGSSGNSTTTIRFILPEKDKIELEIFSLLGERVRTIVDGEFEVGEYSVVINAQSLASGRYYYRLKTSKGAYTKTMILLK